MVSRREFLPAVAAGLALPLIPAPAGADTNALVRQLEADLQQHAAFGEKFSGGTGNLSTADWIAGRLTGLGYAVDVSIFDVPFFSSSRSVLQVDQVTAEIIPQSIVTPTGSSGVKAPLAVIRTLYDAVDAKDRIALVILPYGRHAAIMRPPIAPLVKAAAKAGAKAVIIVTTGPSGEAVALNTPVDEPFVPIPTAILAPRDAEPFVMAARTGTPATMVIDGVNERRPTRNIVGRLVRGSQWLALSTPRSGWFQCVGERGTGTAAFLVLAEWIAKRFPDISVFAMNTGGHELDFRGMHLAMAAAPPAESTKLFVQLGAGLATRDCFEFGGKITMLPSADPNRMLMVSENILPIATKTFSGLTGLEQPMSVMKGAGELSDIMAHGYPTAFAVLGVHRWFHTRADGLDKVDARLLAPVVEAHQRLIEHVLSRS
jgi:hypothetical protein